MGPTDWSRTFTATQARRSSSEWRQVRIPTCTTATAGRPKRHGIQKAASRAKSRLFGSGSQPILVLQQQQLCQQLLQAPLPAIFLLVSDSRLFRGESKYIAPQRATEQKSRSHSRAARWYQRARETQAIS